MLSIKEKIEKIKNYLLKFENIELIKIDEKEFKTFCKIHNHYDIHNTFTFYKNYVLRNASPCKICRNILRIEKIKNTYEQKNIHNKTKEKQIIKKDKKKSECYENEIERAKEIHNNFYSYEKVTVNNFKNPYWVIVCPEHGEFKQLKKEHLKGKKCFQCYVKKSFYDYNFFVKNFIKENSLLSVTKNDYKGFDKLSQFKCSIHGYFNATPENIIKHGIEHGCTKCFENKKLWKNKVSEYVNKSLKIKTIEHNFKLKLNNFSFEIDIYCPEEKIGIECIGVYWDSENLIDKNYHIKKTEACEKLGIRLIHIFDDEWWFKQTIVENILRTLFNKNNRVEYARNLRIEEINEKIAKKFYDSYHVQGWCRSSLSLGAFNEFYQLVACMSFSNKRPGIGSKNTKELTELTRYATDGGRYPGLASKFFKHYLRNYHKSGRIISYADRRFYTGKVYPQMGFTEIRRTGPNYFYVIDNKRMHRFSFSKTRLKEIFGKDVCEKYTEREIMEGVGIPKVYDCGHIVYEYK